MAIETIKKINVDFYDNKYILINAKQYDSSSRWISITCYNQGDLFNLSANKHSAYVKFRKADGHGVLNSCKINARGEVLVELTEQMLAAGGICYVDLTIINKGHALVNIDTGDIVAVDDTPILSTMAFCVNIYETVVDNSDIESSYEYNALNDLMQRAESDYTEVIKLAKSYAVGDANEIRDNEDTDNAKYYCGQAGIYASNIKDSEENIKNLGDLAISYAIGGTGKRENEDVDNARYYCEVVKSVVDGLNSGFIPIGTIAFAELATAQKATGFTYNISDDFVTDDTFAEGAGKTYTAGVNVYCRSDGLWDCFGGSASLTVTVDEVIDYLNLYS